MFKKSFYYVTRVTCNALPLTLPTADLKYPDIILLLNASAQAKLLKKGCPCIISLNVMQRDKMLFATMKMNHGFTTKKNTQQKTLIG